MLLLFCVTRNGFLLICFSCLVSLTELQMRQEDEKMVDIKCHQQFSLKAFFNSSGFCMELDGAFTCVLTLMLEFFIRAR